jgi:hypothetical protein
MDRSEQSGFTLVDLLLVMGSVIAGWLVSQAVLSRLGVPVKGPVAVALLVVTTLGVAVVVCSWLYRTLKFLPPVPMSCPHCASVPDGYWFQWGVHWPHCRVKCGRCNGETDLLLARERPPCAAGDVPTLLLRWPWCLGIWTRVR